MNGRKKAVLSLLDGLEDDQLRGEVVRGAVTEGVIRDAGDVERVVLVPRRHIANIVTR